MTKAKSARKTDLDIFFDVFDRLMKSAKQRRKLKDMIEIHDEEALIDADRLLLSTYKELRESGMAPFPATEEGGIYYGSDED